MRALPAIPIASLSLLVAASLLVSDGAAGPGTASRSPDGWRREPRRPNVIAADAWQRMLGNIEADRYGFRPRRGAAGAGGYEAANPEHGIRIAFTENGVGIRPAGSSEVPWEWTLQLERFGYAGDLEDVTTAAPVLAGNRIEYRRGALTEWYLNDRGGLEQGFTVASAPSKRRAALSQRSTAAPSGTGDPDTDRPLVIQMRTTGLQTRQEVAGASILATGAERDAILRYRGLVAWDANGDRLRAEMWTTDERIRIAVYDAGASYPLTIDPLIQRTILRASDAQSADEFGYSVAISGATAIVGAVGEDGGTGNPLVDAGAAYLFERNQGGVDNWGQVRKLTASDAQANDNFGWSVAISGDTAIVGAILEDGGVGNPLSSAGAAYLFERNQGGAGNWGEVKKLTASDPQAMDSFGYSVSISADTAIVGAAFEDGGPGNPRANAGAAYLFERDQGGAGNWGEVKKLTASDTQASDAFGWSVAISGDRAIVGAPLEDGGAGNPLSAAGAAYLFARNQGGAGNWGEAKKLTASDAQANDQFGDSVAVSGVTAIVGALLEDGGPLDPLPDSGAAYVFLRDQGGPSNWGERTRLTPPDPQADDHYGSSVAIAGNIAVIGAEWEDGANPLSNTGAAYVFVRRPGGTGDWRRLEKVTASDSQPDDHFGYSVAISGATMIIGARGEDGGPGNPLPSAGAAYVVERAVWAFVLDGFGGLHASGRGVVPIIGPPPPYFGFDVARDLELTDEGAHVLDGFGGVHPAGLEPPLSPEPPYFGFDIAEDFELAVAGDEGAYALDGFGGVHAFGSAPPLGPATPYFGFDVARDLELTDDGHYVLDGFGGLHAGGSAGPMSPGPPYFGFDIAKDLELSPEGGAYVLDGFGGVHAVGGAPALSPATPYFGFNMARDLELMPGADGYFVLDGFGGLHPGGGAPPIAPAPPYFGFDVTRDLEIR